MRTVIQFAIVAAMLLAAMHRLEAQTTGTLSTADKRCIEIPNGIAVYLVDGVYKQCPPERDSRAVKAEKAAQLRKLAEELDPQIYKWNTYAGELEFVSSQKDGKYGLGDIRHAFGYKGVWACEDLYTQVRCKNSNSKAAFSEAFLDKDLTSAIIKATSPFNRIEDQLKRIEQLLSGPQSGPGKKDKK